MVRWQPVAAPDVGRHVQALTNSVAVSYIVVGIVFDGDGAIRVSLMDPKSATKEMRLKV